MTTTVDHPRIGYYLANGCRVIAARRMGGRDERYVVLAMSDASDDHDPYITWVWDGGFTYWGHYFSDIAEAARDFKERP